MKIRNQSVIARANIGKLIDSFEKGHLKELRFRLGAEEAEADMPGIRAHFEKLAGEGFGSLLQNDRQLDALRRIREAEKIIHS